MTADELTKRIRAHDHYYEYADDHKAWLSGQFDFLELVAELRRVPMPVALQMLELVPEDRRTVWLLAISKLK